MVLVAPILDAAALAPIKDSTLFYPCSGDDHDLPLRVFGPHCAELWFVDVNCFRQHPPETMRPALSERNGYALVDVRIHLPDLAPEEWSNDLKYDCQPPRIRTEIYLHRESRHAIRVHRHRRRGPSALRKQIDRLGVFFYRGDSEEGGSATHWLTVREWHRRNKRKRRRLIHELLDKLIDGGLIVTDGSMCRGEHNPYRELRRLHCNRTIAGDAAVAEMKPFVDDEGRSFRCIGCLGQHHHYGPTMVWQVRKPPVEA